MREFRDRVAVVTGAASGIGLAMCERFADEGMKLVMADVEEDALSVAAGKLESRGARTLAVRTDVTRAADVDALAEKTLAAFGAVHVVCNNAGVGGDSEPCWEQSLESWKWVLDVNLWGVIHGLRTFVPILLRQGEEAHVVNTASMAGHLSVPLFSPYHVSKFAVVTLSESLHYELEMAGGKVKASVLCPGFVKTRIMDSGRNRPRELDPDPERQGSEAGQAMRAAYTEFVGAGIPPDEVAQKVLEAIRDERFYVFPHPEMLENVRGRMESILAQRNPELELPPEMRERLDF